MYSQIMQGQAAAAEQQYYQQMMNQPQVEAYVEQAADQRPYRLVY